LRVKHAKKAQENMPKIAQENMPKIAQNLFVFADTGCNVE
jgi:hypothetical protein